MTEHPTHFLLVTILVLATVLLVFAMKYGAASRQARARAAGENAYRDMASRAVKAQEDGAAALVALKQDVDGLQSRLRSVETMLKEVG